MIPRTIDPAPQAPSMAVARMLLDFDELPAALESSPVEALLDIHDDLSTALAEMVDQGVPENFMLPLNALRSEAVAILATERAENRAIVSDLAARLQVAAKHVLDAIDAAKAAAAHA